MKNIVVLIAGVFLNVAFVAFLGLSAGPACGNKDGDDAQGSPEAAPQETAPVVPGADTLIPQTTVTQAAGIAITQADTQEAHVYREQTGWGFTPDIHANLHLLSNVGVGQKVAFPTLEWNYDVQGLVKDCWIAMDAKITYNVFSCYSYTNMGNGTYTKGEKLDDHACATDRSAPQTTDLVARVENGTMGFPNARLSSPITMHFVLTPYTNLMLPFSSVDAQCKHIMESLGETVLMTHE